MAVKNDETKKERIESGIFILYGLPGAGKSYSMASMARDYLDCGHNVLSTYPIRDCRKISIEQINTDLVISDSLILIDEAHELFNSRKFKSFTRNMHEFFSMHRHYGNRIVLCTQHPARLDTVIREISEAFIYCSTLKLFGRPVLLTLRYYAEDPCRSVSVGTDSLIRPYRVSRSFYRSEIMNMYDSFCFAGRDMIDVTALPLWDFESCASIEPLPRACWNCLKISSENLYQKLIVSTYQKLLNICSAQKYYCRFDAVIGVLRGLKQKLKQKFQKIRK